MEAPGEKEGPVLTLGRPGRVARFMQSGYCLRFLVEPAWTMHSHPNGEQETRTKGTGKGEEADVCRARHELAPEGLPAPLMMGRALSGNRQQLGVRLVGARSLALSGIWQGF